MNSQAPMAGDLSSGPARMTRSARELARWAVAGVLAFLLTAAAILWWRRLAGAFSDPLEPWALLVVSTLIAALVVLTRMTWRYAAGGRGGGWSRLTDGAVSTATVAVAAALSCPGTPVRGLVILWGFLAAEECWAWGLADWGRFPAVTRARSADPEGTRAALADSPASRAAVWPTTFDHPLDGEVTQQMTRSQTPGGGEVLSGWLRVWMAAGQRSASVHVAFCPSFGRTPRVSVAQRGGPPARIKTVQVLPQGARFDLKLAAPGEAAEGVLLEFSAEAAPAATGSEPTGPEPASDSEA